jgi:transposase
VAVSGVTHVAVRLPEHGSDEGSGVMERVRVRPLTDAEREVLLRWVKSASTPLSLQRRARVILLSSYDISTYVIAILIPMGRNNVSYWIRRFNEEGLDGLRDRPRPGRPRRPAGAEGVESDSDGEEPNGSSDTVTD